MSLCPKCGAQQDDEYLFCTKCGTRLRFPDANQTFTPPAGDAATFTAPAGDASTFTFTTHNLNTPTFTPPAGNIPTFTPSTDGVPTFTPPAGNVPTFTPPTGDASASTFPASKLNAPSFAKTAGDVPTFTPPAGDTSASAFSTRNLKAQNFNQPVGDVPTFTPPTGNAPTFTPPTRNFNGPVCFHHPEEPAVAKCGRCGKYICKDCAEAYTVSGGEYANQCLCYDCCQAIVAENVETLKKQKAVILTNFIITIIGMIIGAALFSSESDAPGSFIIFGMLWGGSFWFWLKYSLGEWWHDPKGPSWEGFVTACLFGALIAPFKTIIKIVKCIKYLISTSKSIENDSEALQQMTAYMEYTQVRSRNKGVDLETLMGQHSELYNNSYAQMVRSQGEAAADEMLRQCTTTIAENGEIIRSFAV